MRSGQRVGKYVLGELIARGGMAEVWAARVEGPGGFVKPLALKFILESFAGDPELERLFVNEARLAARLQHANLVAVFDFDRMGETDAGPAGRYYIAMERVDGHDLRRVVQASAVRNHRLPPSIALYIAGEVLRGLRYVHERRDEPSGKPLELVHRDVSPHNVLIGLGGEVKLSDFGIAKARALTPTVNTQAGTVRGKLAYAAPEQLRGEAIDHRADQFATGIVLWELLAGRRLFDGSAELEIAEKVLGGEIPPLPSAAAVDPRVEAIARRMLSASPRDRFPSTGEALSAVLGAPGYRPDPQPLIDLMQVLFTPQKLPVSPTAPVELADPPASVAIDAGAVPRKRQMPPTIPMDMGEGVAAGGAATVNRPLFPSEGSGSYVSEVGAAQWSRSERRPASPARRLLLAFVAVVVVGGGVGVAIRRLGAARRSSVASAPAATREVPPAEHSKPPIPAPRAIRPPPAAPPAQNAEAPAVPVPAVMPEPHAARAAPPGPSDREPPSVPTAADHPHPPVSPALAPPLSAARPPSEVAPPTPDPAPSPAARPSSAAEKTRKGAAPNAAPILE